MGRLGPAMACGGVGVRARGRERKGVGEVDSAQTLGATFERACGAQGPRSNVDATELREGRGAGVEGMRGAGLQGDGGEGWS